MNDHPEKIAMALAIIAQTLFVVSFLAYCTAPAWVPLVLKQN